MAKGNKSVVVISRDKVLAHDIEVFLSGEGFQANSAVDFSVLPEVIDGMVILDVNLPGDFKLCRYLHQQHFVPILVLGDSREDGVKAFNYGAADFMGKPVNTAELAARVRKIMAASDLSGDHGIGKLINVGDLTIDPLRYMVKVSDKEVKLTSTEFELLLLLASRQGRMVSRLEIAKRLWGGFQDDSDRNLNVHVSRLRRKIEGESKRPRRLVPIRGIGYKLQQ